MKKVVAGMDLHGNNVVIGVMDMDGRRMANRKVPCDLKEVVKFLAPYKKRLERVAVESTYNWYWLVDGLRALKYPVVLANPAGMQQYSGIKHADDIPGSASKLVTNLLLPNTSRITNGYDNVARLFSTALLSSTNSVLDSYAYAYNTANQRTGVTRTDSSSVSFAYDKIGQLTVADSSVNTEDRGYKYDSAWNLNWLTNNGTASRFDLDIKNELTNVFSSSLLYDSNGNLVTNNYLSCTLTYDDENRLTMVSSDFYHTFRSTFAYDGIGRLRKRIDYQWTTGGASPGGGPPPPTQSTWVANKTTLYIYDGWRVIQERDTNSMPAVAYTRGNDLSGSLEGAGGIGGLLARSYTTLPGVWPITNHTYYFADGNGNVTCMTGAGQNIVASYRYDPFGKTLSSSGSLASANLYRFSSKEIHLATGMYYYGYRFYDPSLQRWVRRDPIGERGGLNLYALVYNSPINAIDPLGRKLWYCSRPADAPFNIGGGRHGYFWNDADTKDLNDNPQNRECGQESCSSSGGTDSGNQGPLAESQGNDNYQDPDHWTDGKHECTAVPGADWPDWDDQFMKDCQGRGPGGKGGGINGYPWLACLWHCHDSARAFAGRYGLQLPGHRVWNRQPPFGRRDESTLSPPTLGDFAQE